MKEEEKTYLQRGLEIAHEAEIIVLKPCKTRGKFYVSSPDERHAPFLGVSFCRTGFTLDLFLEEPTSLGIPDFRLAFKLDEEEGITLAIIAFFRELDEHFPIDDLQNALIDHGKNIPSIGFYCIENDLASRDDTDYRLDNECRDRGYQCAKCASAEALAWNS